MNRKKLGIILVVVGLLLAFAVGAIVYIQAEQAAEIAKQMPTVEVVVATLDLPERVAIPETSVVLAKLPADLVPLEAATTLKDAIGKFPLTPIYKSEVLIRSRLADTAGKTGPSFTLKEGMVLVAFPGADLLTSTGAIRPGDKVDILMTIPMSRPASGNQPPVSIPNVTQKLIQAVEVFGIGNFPAATQQGVEGSKGTITFQVSHQDALVMKWIKDSGGNLDLLLRHPNDREPVGTEAITANYIMRQFRFTLAEPLQ